MNITEGIYADFNKVEKGLKIYMKLSKPIAYATLKLIQFMARSIKENIFDKDMVENFVKFAKATNGEYSIYRMPYMSELKREEAISNAKKYLDNAGIKYCVMDSVNDKDNALHISVAKKDEQKFNVMFTDYLKEQLSGGEKTSEDLVNLTDGKTTIISIPDKALDTIKNALSEVNVNFAELPDLVPEDGEKQLRIASMDLNVTKQCYEAYRRSIMKSNEHEPLPDIKIFTEEDYLDSARETPEQYMENSMSEELREKLGKYENMDAGDMEKEMMKWSHEIKDSKCIECQALRSNMAFSEISIDKETLVDKNPMNEQLGRKFPDCFFATIPGTKQEQIVMLPKNQVFKVNDADKDRYVAFVNNQKEVKVFSSNGYIDKNGLYKTGKDLFKKFDRHDNRNMDMQNSINKSAVSVADDVIPKPAPVK